MGKSNNPVDILIQNIKNDQTLLDEKTRILEEAKEEQKEIASRIKEYRKDVAHMWKYMTEGQQAEIESLGLDASAPSGQRGVLNPISQIALDVLMKAKGNKMTNGKLYAHYVDSVGDGEPESYSLFNVKLRQLVNGGRITKEQVDKDKASRDDIMTLHLDSSEK